jgi:uncharacterized protein (DUF305 family)
MYRNKTMTWSSWPVASSRSCVLAATQQQVEVSDTQFLRSMIPHHAGAILMCEESPIQDAEIEALCSAIISSHQAEIDQMKTKLRALDR